MLWRAPLSHPPALERFRYWGHPRPRRGARPLNPVRRDASLTLNSCLSLSSAVVQEFLDDLLVPVWEFVVGPVVAAFQFHEAAVGDFFVHSFGDWAG